MEHINWLSFTGSLTEKMEQQSGHAMTVELLSQGMAPVYKEERQLLKLLPREWAWVRAVKLYLGGEPWVVARTVVPPYSFQGEVNRLKLLKNKPLGPLLFHRLNAKRCDIAFERVQQAHWSTGLQQQRFADPLWCRRSLFYVNHQPLLLRELFLPEHPVYDHEK